MLFRLAGFVSGLVGALLVLPAVACGAAGPSPGEIPAGTWVGDGARATVSAQGASLDLDCAGAEIPAPLSLDTEGRFDLAGAWERRAGPQPYRRQDARFRGDVRGDLMTLAIALSDSGETLGSYELRLGGGGRAPRLCR